LRAVSAASPKPDRSAAQEATGVVTATCDQLTPPSRLRQMPPPVLVLVSDAAVAMTMLALLGKYFTSVKKKVVLPLVWPHVLPVSVVRNKPPEAEATTIRLESPGATDAATARPPLLTLGWNWKGEQPATAAASTTVPSTGRIRRRTKLRVVTAPIASLRNPHQVNRVIMSSMCMFYIRQRIRMA
jgi:hypothetical protein